MQNGHGPAVVVGQDITQRTTAHAVVTAMQETSLS